MSAMLLVIPQHALNVPYARWSVAAICTYGAFAGALDGPSPRSMGTATAAWLLALASVAFALSTTFYLRARGDELRVVTIYKRSSLALSRSFFVSKAVGRGRSRSWALIVSDGDVRRKLNSYYFFASTAGFAVRRLEKHLLPSQ